MKQYKGRIDVRLAEQFESDHYDTYAKTDQADERTLCGHTESSPRGAQVFNDPPYNPGGAVQGKVTDSQMAADMTFVARRGHPCGTDFLATPFLQAHPEFSWMAPVLEDMKAGPWTEFHSDEKP